MHTGAANVLCKVSCTDQQSNRVNSQNCRQHELRDCKTDAGYSDSVRQGECTSAKRCTGQVKHRATDRAFRRDNGLMVRESITFNLFVLTRRLIGKHHACKFTGRLVGAWTSSGAVICCMEEKEVPSLSYLCATTLVHGGERRNEAPESLHLLQWTEECKHRLSAMHNAATRT